MGGFCLFKMRKWAVLDCVEPACLHPRAATRGSCTRSSPRVYFAFRTWVRGVVDERVSQQLACTAVSLAQLCRDGEPEHVQGGSLAGIVQWARHRSSCGGAVAVSRDWGTSGPAAVGFRGCRHWSVTGGRCGSRQCGADDHEGHEQHGCRPTTRHSLRLFRCPVGPCSSGRGQNVVGPWSERHF